MRRTQFTIRLLGNDRLQVLVFQVLLSSLQTETNKNPDSNILDYQYQFVLLRQRVFQTSRRMAALALSLESRDRDSIQLVTDSIY